ncbi:MAG TPA: hypothetical protein PKW90_27575, partial [Myxococcota bacterium]|nr:hypothetical protein [Myxococcota bacterium]
IRLALGEASALVSLRLVPGVEVATGAESLWARGRNLDPILEALLRGLPLEARYRWQLDDRLLEVGRRIPTTALPSGPWVPIAEWLTPRLPTPALPGTLPAPTPLTLEPSSQERPARLLLAELADWEDYSSTCAEIRLSKLSFAVNEPHQVLIHGEPLPPLQGQRWTVVENIGIPIGYTWRPSISASLLAEAMNATPHALLVWFTTGQVERVQWEPFLPATRANIRATAASRSLAS